MTLQIRLKNILEEKDLKPIELSKLTGITASSISDWLNGKYEPKADKIYLMAEALGVSPAWLMGKDVPKDRNANPYVLVQNYIVDLIEKGQIKDIDSIPSSILLKLHELNNKCMIEFIRMEIDK